MLQLENVILPKETDKNGIEVVAKIDEFLVPLVEKLALTHPEWRFESYYCRKNFSSGVNGADFGMEVERVKVMDKYEELGLLGSDYTRTGKRFLVSNHRTEKVRERGTGMKTIHLDKAIKHVEKYFGRKNNSEKIEQAEQLSQNVVRDAVNNTWYPMRNVWNDFEDVARLFVNDHLDTFKSYLQTNTNATSTALAKLDTLPEKIAEWQGCKEIQESYNKGQHSLVFLDGMNYIVKHANQVQVKTSEELPDYVRRGVGMLKLVEPRHAISNVGVRVDDTTFVVIPPNIVS